MPWKTALHSIGYSGLWPGQIRLPLDAFLDKAKALGYDGVMLMAKRPHLSVRDFAAATSSIPPSSHRLRPHAQLTNSPSPHIPPKPFLA